MTNTTNMNFVSSNKANTSKVHRKKNNMSLSKLLRSYKDLTLEADKRVYDHFVYTANYKALSDFCADTGLAFANQLFIKERHHIKRYILKGKVEKAVVRAVELFQKICSGRDVSGVCNDAISNLDILKIYEMVNVRKRWRDRKAAYETIFDILKEITGEIENSDTVLTEVIEVVISKKKIDINALREKHANELNARFMRMLGIESDVLKDSIDVTRMTE